MVLEQNLEGAGQRAAYDRMLARRQGSGPAPKPRSTVVEGSWSSPTSNEDDIATVVQASICQLTGHADLPSAMASLVEPGEPVAIRVGSFVHPAVLDTVVGGLLATGAPPSSIRLVHSGAAVDTTEETGPRGVAIEAGDYAQDSVQVGSIELHLARSIAESRHLINLAALNTHVHAQLTGALKNHIGSVDEPWRLHTPLDVNTALLNALPSIRERTVLVIIDAWRPCLAGHPDFRDERYLYDARSVIASRDPVAADRVGAGILQRGFDALGHPGELGYALQTLALAAGLGLGNDDPSRIDHRSLELG
jgi:hypothetical protein